MNFIKYIKRQDCGWKQQYGYSGETSINLSKEICDYLTFGLVTEGEEINLTFLIYKEDFTSALDFIKSQCPLYRSTSRTCNQITCDNSIFKKLSFYLNDFFGTDNIAEYSVTLYKRNDGRIYLKGLKQKGFTIRDYLVESSSALYFNDNDGVFEMRILSATCEPINNH